jgi:hypothetical protein
MSLLAVLPDQVTGLIGLVLLVAGGAPEPEDVKAGWTAFAIFLLLALAVAILGRSLFKHLRKAEAAQEAGLYDGDTRDTRDTRNPRDGDTRDTLDERTEPAPGSDDGEPHRS